jgi:hypothetical protein
MQAIKDLPLSHQSVTRWVEEMGEGLQNKLKMDSDNCCYFSLQFDELTDIVDTYQIIMFISLVFPDMIYKEEFLTMTAIKGTTTGEEIYQTFVSFLKKTSLHLWKLVCIATDKAPAMVGENNGFLAL